MLEVIVPATSANIGPGYDCLGIALNLYNKFYFCEIEKGLIIDEKEEEYINKDNLVYKSMMYFFDKIKPKKISKGIKIKIVDDVPISRGLDSSATCIVAGLLAANYLSNSHLDKSEILKEIEIENYIWIVYLGLIIFSFWSNNEERKYIIFGDISAKENYRKSLVLVFSIASIIYFYFFYSSYRSYKNLDKNDTDSKKYFTVINLIATTLVLIAGILFLFIAIEDEELETEISF